MSAVAGYAGKVYYAPDSTGSPGSWVLIANVNAGSIKSIRELLDTTSFSSGGRKARIAGLKDNTPSLAADYNAADTSGQVAMRADIEAGNPFWLKILEDGTNGKYLQVLGSDSTVASKADGKTTWECTVAATGLADPVAVP